MKRNKESISYNIELKSDNILNEGSNAELLCQAQ